MKKQEKLSDAMRQRRDDMDADAAKELQDKDVQTMMDQIVRLSCENDYEPMTVNFGGIDRASGEEFHFKVTVERVEL